MNRPGQQRGVALLIVLLIVAIVFVLATEMGSRLQLNVQRVQNIKDSNQAQWYAYSAEAFARKSIKTIFEQTDDKIHIGQPWSEQFTFPLDNGGIQVQLVDMQSCFNLNALAEASADDLERQKVTPRMEAFERLLENVQVEPQIESLSRETVRDSLADWLDSDQRMREYGAEDSEYESREFPYLAANRLMVSQSELRVINGVSVAWLNQIWKLICVIPNSSQLVINVNTLTPEHAPVLAGLTGISMSDATGLIGRRPSNGWDSVADFLAENELDGIEITDEQRDWFDVKTEYFILHTRTRYNNATFSMSSLFHIPNASKVSVIRREFGGIE